MIRANWVYAFLATLILSALVWSSYFLHRNGEPVYRSRKLGEWLDLAKDGTSLQRREAADAVREIGTNAVPALLASARPPSPLHVWLDKYLMYGPRVTKRMAESSADRARRRLERAAMGFSIIGKPALPILVSILTNTNASPLERVEVAKMMIAMGSSRATGATEILSRCAFDPDPTVAASCAETLGFVLPNYAETEPLLRRLTNSANTAVRVHATIGLMTLHMRQGLSP